MRNNLENLSSTLRYETKYRINYHQYYKIRNGIYPFVKKDFFTKLSEDQRYLVNSLYYDSFDYKIYFEKIGGNCDRIKFRIRTYGDSTQKNPDIRVEMKIRRGNLTEKFSTFVDVEDCQQFLITKHWENREDPVLIEFERQLHLRELHPKLLVQYYREGFQSIDGKETRITFDHNVRSAPSSILFPSKKFWHSHHEQMIVLEIKHQGNIQGWLHNLILVNDIKVVANSKFALGIMASQPGIIVPAWSRG